LSRRRASWGLALVLATALVLQATDGWQRLQASRLVWQVQREAHEMARRGRVPAGLLAQSLEALRRARSLDPVSIEALAAHGDLLLLMGRLESAEATYREGLTLEPRSEIFFNLGLTLWALRREGEAVESFGRAVRVDPRLDRQLPAEVRERLSPVGGEVLLDPLFDDGFETAAADTWSH
jgi:tetratricopeptide (TPR) repeat protein